MIQVNRHPDGRISNIVFGLCHLADGIVRAGSLGFLHTTFPLDYARYVAKRRFQRQQAKFDATSAFLRSKLEATNADTKKILTAAGAVYDRS
jgi:acetaldehyde dehydrogenase (acetylating)